MKRASIISKQGRHELSVLVSGVAKWLRDHGYSITVDEVSQKYWPQGELADQEDLVEKNPDFVVVLGGDGTLLSTARNVAHAGIPILGVNLGSLGFLTEIRKDEIDAALEAVDAGRCELSLRSMLHCQVRRGDECLANYDALNEAVLNQSAVARINEFDVLIDGVFVANYKADGLIISTPTGSTAYSLAAGGPILTPDLPGFVITPVASHALTNRPLVVPDTAVIEVRLSVTREQGYLTVDGQLGEPLEEGDAVFCRLSKYQVRLFKMPDTSFFDVLRAKLKWGER